MQGVIALLEQYAINRIMGAGSPVSHKSKAGLGLMALAGFLLLLGLGFLTYALNLWLYEMYAPQVATAITGGLCIFASLLIVMIGYLILQFKKMQHQKSQQEAMEMAVALIDYAQEELREPVEQNPKTSLALAATAGFVAGQRYL
ncbi:MAG: hypothetical protein CMH27_04775 [Micavibrio sp.]|nr:hypothetical protein [Micavibrio sp.]|tara:strand:+ start:4370 stop:4804 length:435 start_codon:yes stop_codon:yes gene_type:complete